jgi:hypothetical protein
MWAVLPTFRRNLLTSSSRYNCGKTPVEVDEGGSFPEGEGGEGVDWFRDFHM